MFLMIIFIFLLLVLIFICTFINNVNVRILYQYFEEIDQNTEALVNRINEHGTEIETIRNQLTQYDYDIQMLYQVSAAAYTRSLDNTNDIVNVKDQVTILEDRVNQLENPTIFAPVKAVTVDKASQTVVIPPSEESQTVMATQNINIIDNGSNSVLPPEEDQIELVPVSSERNGYDEVDETHEVEDVFEQTLDHFADTVVIGIIDTKLDVEKQIEIIEQNRNISDKYYVYVLFEPNGENNVISTVLQNEWYLFEVIQPTHTAFVITKEYLNNTTTNTEISLQNAECNIHFISCSTPTTSTIFNNTGLFFICGCDYKELDQFIDEHYQLEYVNSLIDENLSIYNSENFYYKIDFVEL
jgi:hypothetical protein